MKKTYIKKKKKKYDNALTILKYNIYQKLKNYNYY